MKFQPTPSREKIFAFQKGLKVFAALLLMLMGCGLLYQAYIQYIRTGTHPFSDALTSLLGALLFFGLSFFLYSNRANNTQRYDGIPGYGP